MSNIESRIIALISKEIKVAPEKVILTANLIDDLGLDSLSLAELVMAFESEFECSISDEEQGKIKTVADVIDTISSKITT